jgi:hypothetical protein
MHKSHFFPLNETSKGMWYAPGYGHKLSEVGTAETIAHRHANTNEGKRVQYAIKHPNQPRVPR